MNRKSQLGRTAPTASALDLLLKGGASALALSIMTAPAALAQDEPPAAEDEETSTDEIVVRSFRRSLMNAQDIKRNADNFKDAVSAEDISALPDRSVLEALQRIPGISISRFAAGDDPDHFSVEGSGVVVRGLNFVRSELNGRDTFSANNGRALSFSDVPPELLQAVEVSKNNSADMIEGGLAGTVNLITRKPFDQPGRVFAGSAEANYGDFREKWSPTVSALFSDRWDTGAGEFGLLLNGVFSELKTRSDGIQASNFGCRQSFAGVPVDSGLECELLGGETVEGVYFPRGAAFRSQDTDRERIGYAAAAQWANPSDSLVATFQFLRSESSVSWTETGSEIATDVVRDQGDARPVAGTSFEFGDDGIFTRGVITGPTGWKDDGNYNWRVSDCNSGQAGCFPRAPVWGLQSNNFRRDVEQEYVTSDYGLNLKWTPTDRLRLNFDAQYVTSSVTNLDVSFWSSTFQNASLDFSGDIPVVQFLPPSIDGDITSNLCTEGGLGTGQYPGPEQATGSGTDGCSFYNSFGFLDPEQYFWRSAMDHYEDSEGEEIAFQGDAEYEIDKGWLKAVRIGGRYAERDQTTRWSTYNWGVTSEIWGSGGPVWFDEGVDGVPNPNGFDDGNGIPSTNVVFADSFDNFFRGKTPYPFGDTPLLFYDGNMAKNYDEWASFARLVSNEWRCEREDGPASDGDPTTCDDATGAQQNWVPLRDRDGVVPGTWFLPNEINDTLEKSWSTYFMVRYGGEFPSGVTLDGNAGVRVVHTSNTANGSIGYPQPSDLPPESDCFPDPDAPPGTPFNPPAFCELTSEEREAARRFANGASVEDDGFHEYTNVLPSVNFKLGLTEDFLIRFGWSKSIARPELGLTRNFVTIIPWQQDNDGDGDEEFLGFQVENSGNAGLEPIKSSQFDLSFEWYFDEAGSLTLALFTKNLKDVHTNGLEFVPFTNNGETFNVPVLRPVNAEETGRIRGLELAYQQFYDFLPSPLDGVGVQFNYTYIDSQGVPQQNLSENNPDGSVVDPNDPGNGKNFTIDTSNLPLVGLSTHNVNAAFIYEKGPISARLAYNWRSRYLLTVRDVIVPHAPIFNDATGQMDATIFYNINDNVKIGVQGVNLLNEVTKTSQVLNNNLLTAGRSWFINDRRITLIARWNF